MGNGVEFKDQYSEEDVQKAKEALNKIYDQALEKLGQKKKRLKSHEKQVLEKVDDSGGK
ncbi:MAG: hypothetical protein AABW87_04105 [Nanoarchaeota archaeon]